MKFNDPWNHTMTLAEERRLADGLRTETPPALPHEEEVRQEILRTQQEVQKPSKKPVKVGGARPTKTEQKKQAMSSTKQVKGSLNQIEIDLREMEVLRVMREKQMPQFAQFVNQRTHPTVFKDWIDQNMFRHELDHQRRENLRRDQSLDPNLTFRPEIGEKSRQLAAEWREKHRAEVEGGTQGLGRTGEVSGEAKKVFNQKEFEGLMTRINFWNQNAKNKRLMNVLSSLAHIGREESPASMRKHRVPPKSAPRKAKQARGEPEPVREAAEKRGDWEVDRGHLLNSNLK